MKTRLLSLLLLLGTLMASVACSGDKPDTPDTPEIPAETDLSTLPSGNMTVIYEANPKVFARQNALKSIESNLDRLTSMKVNVLWLMPVYPVGKDPKAVGSPYCVKDYKAVNPDFGTLDDLKSLVRSAHAKGMKVILDWVANHTSWDNAWITEHPDWYTKDANGQIISPAGMGWNDVADLNFNSSGLRGAMKDAMCWWVREVDVDGFRCDYTDGVPTDFWSEAITALKALKGDVLMLGESGDSKYYNCGFNLLYAWAYANNLPGVFKGSGTVSNLYSIVRSDVGGLKEGQNRMRYSINHDTASENAPATLYGGADGAMAAFVLSAFLPGVPMIYSSQEIGYGQKLNFFNYVVMDWNSNATCSDAYKRIMKAYTDTEKYRGSAPQLIENGKVATVLYKAVTRRLLVLVNTGSAEATVKVPMETIGGNYKDLVSGMALSLPSTVTLGGYGCKIYAK